VTDPKISPDNAAVVPDPGTPAAGGDAVGASPAVQGGDAGDLQKQVESLRTQLARYQEDINKQKSSFQKRESELEKEWKRQEQELRRQLTELQRSRLSGEELEEFERSQEQTRWQQQVQQVQEERDALREQLEMNRWLTFFMERGVSTDKLVTDQGVTVLWESGMKVLDERLKSPAPAPAPQTEPQRQPAPRVDTGGGAPQVKATWAELIAKHGSADRIFRLIELGQLSPDILPD
jgi:hypothetical protein